MDEKLLVTLRQEGDADAVRQTGVQILASYPHTVLVRATTAQRQALEQAGVEVVALEQPPTQRSGASFHFAAAVAANEAAPVVPDPDRRAYYLIRLIGPAKSEWLIDLRARGVTIQTSLPGFTLLAGLLPRQVDEIRGLDWVEEITAYRPAMKISPKLVKPPQPSLGMADLMGAGFPPHEAEVREQVEISLFAGESTNEIADLVTAAGGIVLGETAQDVIATVSRETVTALAHHPAVQAILPYAPTGLNNDCSAPVMGVPENRVFGDLPLDGAGQIVAVADTGLDTGDPATIHPDFRDRLAEVKRMPVRPGFLPFMADPGIIIEGPADPHSGHGTHVAGSIAGTGRAATERGDPTVPRGIAPGARIYFQAIEQGVNWKSATTLQEEGRIPFHDPWPPNTFDFYANPVDINELLEPAYGAGARIHSNSWGSTKKDVHGAYTAMARAVDAFLWLHRDMLVLFSAGNDGVDIADGGDGFVDSDSITPPATAKNCLTVGASEGERPPGSSPAPGIDRTWVKLDAPGSRRFAKLAAAGHISDNVEGMAAFSSRGPTDDKRIKPDVVAPGTNILSVRSQVYDNPDDPVILDGDLAEGHPLRGFYCWSRGTSMSTPLVAGAVALIRQYLVQERGHVLGGSKPSGALLKALVINGAVPLRGQYDNEVPAGPNSVSGFGRVNLKESLGLDGAAPIFFSDGLELAVETGEDRTIELEAIDLGRPLKVTLVWTDAEGAADTGGLQNALYLRVRDPSGAVLDGDVSAFPTPTNNVQQVTIPEPVAGTYEVVVHGYDVRVQHPRLSPDETFRQDFALAASNARDANHPPDIDVTVEPI